MALTLERIVFKDLAYIAKLNANAAAVEAAINGIVSQLNTTPQAAATLPAALRALFGDTPAVIGAGSFAPTVSGTKLNIAAGKAWCPGLGAVVANGSTQQIEMVALTAGTYSLVVDASGVATLESGAAADALYSIVLGSSGSVSSGPTRTAAVAWGHADWLAAQASTALSENFTSLDARFEAVETLAVGAAEGPDLSGYETTAHATATFAPLTQPVLLPAFYPGKPGASAVMLAFLPTVAVTIPAGLTGTRAKAGTNPTAPATLTIKKNGSDAGTIQIAANGDVSLTAASPISLTTGDELTVVAPASQDATLADVRLTIAGTR